MGYYTRNMTQTATYFAPNGRDGFGELSFAAGVNVACRWQDKIDLIRDSEGREVVSTSVVYIGQLVAIGGKLALGAGASEGLAREIRNVGVSPSLDGVTELVKAWL